MKKHGMLIRRLIVTSLEK